MFCSNCGREIDDKAVVCVGCGASVKNMKSMSANNAKASAGWWWLGFLIPLAGLLVFICCNDSNPAKAKKAGIGALVGFIVSVVLSIVCYAAFVGLAFYGLSDFAQYSYYM